MTAAISPKAFIITGAARGIGRGLSRLLLQKGHRVLLLDSNTSELSHTATLLSRTFTRGTNFEIHLCNLRSSTEITTAVSSAKSFFPGGKLDVLINNAGYTAGVGGAKLEDDEFLEVWNATLETNLTGTVLMTRACLGMLRQPHTDDDSSASSNSSSSSIINISSTRAHQSEAHSESYAASKAGLLGLSHALSVSLNESPSKKTRRIRVNTILPGWIHVGNENSSADENGTAWEEGLTEEDHAWHLTGRVGRVEDVLRAVEYLVDAEGVTGSEVVVDGGVSRRMVYPE
ncbi:NAD(P)-binding protein [Dissoconium aciculare CBS 342.82]|uniref:NAD(P)-binding protein n=1 Tax=Dissoconium aciculare CBS 342.82 TaxID=1314786 RepID=A0A6J3LZM6_9PEZI|nr:NAD(P)-binding protein [Dissoconium aciculare CBS 342.82]KAF1821245.1 NAD(P)-binding protein [Dissoconium aciculare CBS 342.82]